MQTIKDNLLTIFAVGFIVLAVFGGMRVARGQDACTPIASVAAQVLADPDVSHQALNEKEMEALKKVFEENNVSLAPGSTQVHFFHDKSNAVTLVVETDAKGCVTLTVLASTEGVENVMKLVKEKLDGRGI